MYLRQLFSDKKTKLEWTLEWTEPGAFILPSQ